jgi:tripartite-type tricarboxylate transporter receptor subunit TctC
MNESKLFLSIKLLALTLTVCLNSASNAQDYPAKPIKMIVPYTPGGSIDNTCRLMADQLQRQLGKVCISQPPVGRI